MAGGGSSTSTQSPAADTKSSPALTAEQMQAMSDQKLSDAHRTQYLASSQPVQQYYNPVAQQSTFSQSPTLQVPGFQGVRNPFVSPATFIQQYARPQQSAAQVANLLSQTNQYRQNNATQLYQAQQANQAQLAMLQKAYQDKQASDKAKAEAAAAAAANPWGAMLGGSQDNTSAVNMMSTSSADGGIISLLDKGR